MNTKMYVGNLPYDVTQSELQTHFETQGAVSDVHIVTDRDTGRARGFAFVTMEDASGMQDAIKNLDGQEFGGRELKINEARPREDRGNRGGHGGFNNQSPQRKSGGSRKGQRSDNRW